MKFLLVLSLLISGTFAVLCQNWTCAQVQGANSGGKACIMKDQFNQTIVLHTNNAGILYESIHQGGTTFSTQQIASSGSNYGHVCCAVIDGYPLVVSNNFNPLRGFKKGDDGLWHYFTIATGLNGVPCHLAELVDHNMMMIRVKDNTVYSTIYGVVGYGFQVKFGTVIDTTSITWPMGFFVIVFHELPMVLYTNRDSNSLKLGIAADVFGHDPWTLHTIDSGSPGTTVSAMIYGNSILSFYESSGGTQGLLGTYVNPSEINNSVIDTLLINRGTRATCADGFPSAVFIDSNSNTLYGYTQEVFGEWNKTQIYTAGALPSWIDYAQTYDGYGVALQISNSLYYCHNPEECYSGATCPESDDMTHTQTHTRTHTETSTNVDEVFEMSCPWTCEIIGTEMGSYIDIGQSNNLEFLFHSFGTMLYFSYKVNQTSNFTHLMIWNSTQEILAVAGTNEPSVYFITENTLYYQTASTYETWLTPSVVQTQIYTTFLDSLTYVWTAASYFQNSTLARFVRTDEVESFVFSDVYSSSPISSVWQDIDLAILYHRPIVCFVVNDTLFYAEQNDGTWDIENLGTAVNCAIDNYYGIPTISYSTSNELKLTSRINNTWVVKSVDDHRPWSDVLEMSCIGGESWVVLHQDHADHLEGGLRLAHGNPYTLIWIEQVVYPTLENISYMDVERVYGTIHVFFQENTSLIQCTTPGDCIIEEECNITACSETDECDFAIYPDTCSYECQWIECGNDRVDPTEECEPSLTPENCTEFCLWSVCGNLILEPGEFCDSASIFCSDTCEANTKLIMGMAAVGIIGVTGVGIGISTVVLCIIFAVAAPAAPAFSTSRLPSRQRRIVINDRKHR